MKNPIFFKENHDRQFASHITPDRKKSLRFHGQMREVLSFISDTQLKDREMWDRFIEPYRTHADEGTRGGWRCEYWGKMMRGAAFVYSCTGDEELYRVLLEAVEGLLKTQDELGRISTYTTKEEFNNWDTWGRKYVLLGLLYFREVCRDEDMKERILTAAIRQADYLCKMIGPEEEGKRPITQNVKHWGGLNSSSVLEPIMKLYNITGRKDYLDLAHHIVSCGGSRWGSVLNAAIKDRLYPYQYPVTKAYEMISFFEGVLEYSFVTGNEEYRRAVENFGYRILESDITVIGCSGMMHELFDHSAKRQTSDFYDGIKQETCVSVTWMKFCMRLLSLTGDPIFADCFEQTLYNAYMGSLNTEHVIGNEGLKSNLVEFPPAVPTYLAFDSYADLLRGTRGRQVGGLQQFYHDRTYYGCCACIGAAGAGLAGHMALMRTEGGFALNLYSDLTAHTEAPDLTPVSFSITGGYPRNGVITVAVTPETPTDFSISLRIPSWSERTSVVLNGEEISVTRGYTTLSRRWQAGDVIILTPDMRTRLIRPETWDRDVIRNIKTVIEVRHQRKDDDYFALARGPLVFCREARIPSNSFDPVTPVADENGYVEATLLSPNAVPFPSVAVLQIPLVGDRTMTVADFSSVGKTWDTESEYEVWHPIEV